MSDSKEDIKFEIGDILYHPRIDIINIGFLIEEIIVLKLIGPSKHPSGTFKIIWSYGDIGFLQEQEAQRERRYKTVVKHQCFKSITECMNFLDLQRKRMIEMEADKKSQSLEEIVEMKKWIEEAKKETLTISRKVNKRIAMLRQFDVERDLQKRGLI